MTARIMKELANIKVTLATLMAEKVSWKNGVTAMSAVVVTMFSTIIGVTVYLDGKIEGVMDEVNEVREIAVGNSVKLDSLKDDFAEIKDLLRQNLAQQNIGNFTIDEATLRAIMHPSNDATGGLPITPIYVYVDSDACYITETHPLIATPNTNPTPKPQDV